MNVLAFMGLGLPEMLLIGVAMLLLFGPGFARTLGRLGATALNTKREIEGMKSGLTKRLTQELDSVVRGPKKPDAKKADAPPESEGPRTS